KIGQAGASGKAAQQEEAHRQARQRILVRVAIGAAAVGVVLFLIFRSTAGKRTNGGSNAYQTGQPAAGAAPAIDLASSAGGRFDLSAQRGRTVLLYFQEGVGCEPCWTQIRDIERSWSRFQALGVDEMVSITGNPLSDIRTKVADEGLQTPVLADPDLAVSKSYHANQYGMMGTSADGHTFILVGPDGTIRWRGDYGGAPNYTMYVPINQLTANLQAGMTRA
ncbi:MAG TPA: redoxin domain-containing protein, partial [Acidimicrobiales bacterium]